MLRISIFLYISVKGRKERGQKLEAEKKRKTGRKIDAVVSGAIQR